MPLAITRTPVPRRLARQATQAKRDQLLAGAAELFAKRGFEGTTLRDVGERVGVSLAGMYYYFTSKEHLLFQIQHRTFGLLVDTQMPRAEAPTPPSERLRALVKGHLGFFAQHPNEMKVCTFELDSLTGTPYRGVLDLRRRYYRLMEGVVTEAMDRGGRKARDAGRARKVTMALFGMLNWAFMWYDPARDGDVDRLGDEMTMLILHGMLGERFR